MTKGNTDRFVRNNDWNVPIHCTRVFGEKCIPTMQHPWSFLISRNEDTPQENSYNNTASKLYNWFFQIPHNHTSREWWRTTSSKSYCGAECVNFRGLPSMFWIVSWRHTLQKSIIKFFKKHELGIFYWNFPETNCHTLYISKWVCICRSQI